MPRDLSIKKVLVIGSGPIVIGRTGSRVRLRRDTGVPFPEGGRA